MENLVSILKLAKKADKLNIDIDHFILENDIDFSHMYKLKKLLNAEVLNNKIKKPKKVKTAELSEV
jgi:hypothetical protein